MFNFLHTNKCIKCGKVYQSRDYSENGVCECGSILEYKGLQEKVSDIDNMINTLSNIFKNSQEKEQCKKEIKFENGITAKEITIEEANEVINNMQKNNGIASINEKLNIDGKVTNTKLIPILKLAISENSIEKIELIKNNYPKEYESSLKYIGKKNTVKLNDMLKMAN